jgi:hypothetical protein
MILQISLDASDENTGRGDHMDNYSRVWVLCNKIGKRSNTGRAGCLGQCETGSAFELFDAGVWLLT